MTDITELALRLKLEVHRAVSNFNSQMNIKTRDLKALVEALEKAQQRIAELEEAEQKLCAANVTLDARAELAERQRIAELESRTVTVKLASRRLPSDYVDGEFGNDDLAAIHNACRLECKVSVEKYLSAHGIVVKLEDE
ncbi:hypothetical protein LNM76_25180 [Klebsiella pneumoniae]|uniref:hypothetical protein n=1 Tax=Klebsiella pneumoniae complex TaxID=3390273 RepID=UPI000A26BB63|nr:hypothetical protein [Klebsiella pneumoniae]EKW0019919.1 hypothetical protein [Klebsiella pneumoniae]MBK2567189.1 hypothetical protein [Klebsiella pneumoniae]MCH0770946.1 hypothetical protein [Klebsiella pneumoniae]MCL7693816.1 hypothetical protein [Klebsiella pneumoniae]MCM5790224.1 hypothetical protein [Klebsiella pneumoniae]